MKKRNNFDKKFPLFLKYFQDPVVQMNMVENADLVRKYDTYSETIDFFLKELDKRFDVYVVRNMIVEAIVKLPDNIMMSLITSYLNSSEEAKSNPDFISYYNKTSNMGISSLEYIEKNGLITNRNYKDIPEKALDAKFEDLRSGAEQFNGVGISDIYYTLTIPEKRYVISLIEAKILDQFDVLFDRFNFGFKSLLSVLMRKGIDADILNKNIYDALSKEYVLVLVCLILDNDEAVLAVPNLKKLFAHSRYDLVKSIIDANLFIPLARISLDNLEETTDEKIIEELKRKELVLEKVEN